MRPKRFIATGPGRHTGSSAAAIKERDLREVIGPAGDPSTVDAVITDVADLRLRRLVFRSDSDLGIDGKIGFRSGPNRVIERAVEGQGLPKCRTRLGGVALEQLGGSDDTVLGKGQPGPFQHVRISLHLAGGI